MDYIDFHLKIGPRVGENQYAVATRSSAMGEVRGVFTQPLTDEQLELFVLKVGLARRGVRRLHSPEWRAAQDFGQKLFRSLFTDEVRAAYLASHNEAVRQGKGLRVKLTFDAPELANYPWEFLYDPSTSQFLSLFEDTPVLRYLDLPRPVMPLTVAPPLRILAVASSPKDYEPLDLARERRNLSEALETLLQTGLIELDWLKVATLDALREQLLKRPYHIFHFIGHGGFDENAQDGILIFENASGYANRVSGERLAVILGNHRTLRLAVLNACEGARTSEQDPFAGTAMTLVRTGNLPAVIAMQFEISDGAAIEFASGFYAALATGRPVDAAVSQGRQAIFAANNDVEWSTPVLYLRAPDGVIFQVDTSRVMDDASSIAAEQAAIAEQERRAREKVEAERVAAEQAAIAEQERLARVQLVPNTREGSETERAEKERLETARADQKRVAQEQDDAVRASQARPATTPEAQSIAPSAEQAAMRSPALAEKGAWKAPLILAEILWTLGMGFVAVNRDWVTNILAGVIIAALLMGLVFWWGRRALSPIAHRILLIGMGIGFAVQFFVMFLVVEPIGNAVYENLSPVLALSTASNDFLMTALRSALFALVGSVTAWIVISRQLQGSDVATPRVVARDSDKVIESTAPEREIASEEPLSPPRGFLARIEKQSISVVFAQSVILLALGSAMTGAGSVALSFTSEEQPRIQHVGIVLVIGALLFSAFGMFMFGMAASRLLSMYGVGATRLRRLDRSAFFILIGGALTVTLLRILSSSLYWELVILFGVIGVIVGGSVALALWSSNRMLSVQVLGAIAVGWLIGYLLQGALLALTYPPLLESVWEGLNPLMESVGARPLFTLQIAIVGILIGLIAPSVGIATTHWSLHRFARK